MSLLFLAFIGCTTPSTHRRKTSYIGLGAAYGFEVFDLDEAEEVFGSDLSARGASGGDLRVGHRVHPQVEIEIEARGYDSFEVEASSGTSADVDLRTAGVNVKLYEHPRDRVFPDLSDRWLPYLLLGLAHVDADLDGPQGFLRDFDDSAVAVHAGLGLEVFLSNSFTWFLETSVLEPFDELEGLTVIALTAGLQWRF